MSFFLWDRRYLLLFSAALSHMFLYSMERQSLLKEKNHFSTASLIPLNTGIYAIAYSQDHKNLVVGCFDGTVRVLTISTGAIKSFKCHTDKVYSVAWGFDTIVTGSADKTACCLNSKNGKELQRFSGHTGVIFSVAIGAVGKHVLTGSADTTVCLRDRKTGNIIRTFKGHTKAVLAVAYSPNGSTILTGSADNTFRLWDSFSGDQLYCFNVATNFISSVTYSPIKGFILAGSTDKNVYLCDPHTGGCVLILKGHKGDVTSVAFSPDERLILTGSADRTACLWSAATGEKIKEWKEHKGDVTAVSFNLKGTSLATASFDGNYNGTLILHEKHLPVELDPLLQSNEQDSSLEEGFCSLEIIRLLWEFPKY